MGKKDKLIGESVKVLNECSAWCDANLKGRPQEFTIKDLLRGIETKGITVEQALHIAFVIGLQWEVNFGGS